MAEGLAIWFGLGQYETNASSFILKPLLMHIQLKTTNFIMEVHKTKTAKKKKT